MLQSWGGTLRLITRDTVTDLLPAHHRSSLSPPRTPRAVGLACIAAGPLMTETGMRGSPGAGQLSGAQPDTDPAGRP